ncbi:hypothetical protein F4824DRAFT_499641 [Ustulina deusta]|nr:hypothetical protein F4824DRAFT_499641 [Ustulina deusta]
MAPITPPSDMAAVQHGGQNYIFFVDSQNRIAYYHGGNVQEYQGGDTYSKVNYLQVRTEDIRVTQLVNPNNKAIAAVAYTSATGKELRVYYVNPESVIAELCLSGNSTEWTKGQLLKSKIKVVEKSCVTANVNEYGDADYIKVFVNGAEADGNLLCLYRQVDAQYPQWNRSILTGSQYEPVF